MGQTSGAECTPDDDDDHEPHIHVNPTDTSSVSSKKLGQKLRFFGSYLYDDVKFQSAAALSVPLE